MEYEELRARLQEAEETLDALRTGSVDALIVSGPDGEQVYTLEGADHTYRRLVEDMSEGAVVLTTAGDILYCNRRFAEMLRLPLESVIGSPLAQHIAAEARPALQALLGRALQDRGAEELVLATAENTRLPAYLSAAGLEMAGVSAICVIVADLTEHKRTQQLVATSEKRLEEEQFKANKLESLGIVAGGLAHDINNSLAVILANISLAKRSVASGEVLSRLSEAEMACLGARDVTEQLLTFSKGGTPVKETASIDQLLTDWAAFALSGSNIHCELQVAANVRSVDVDKAQFGRVINNILINAQQAMPEGGTITICANNVTLPRKGNNLAVPLPAGEYVLIRVKDTGMGIPESHIARVFDPYFTTKQRGSGLGLSIAYSVVKAHGGFVAVDSHAGKGTTLSIYLPASSKQPTSSPPEPARPSPGKVKVLVLEDQESIRQIVGEIVVRVAGGEVAFADDGHKAIEIYMKEKGEGRPFDVVLMDLTIPGGMGGKEAVRQLLALDTDAKAVVFSGYSHDPIMSNYSDYGFKAVIRKPFDVDELLDTLRRVTAGTS